MTTAFRPAYVAAVDAAQDRMRAAERQRFAAGEMPDYYECECGEIIRRSLAPLHQDSPSHLRYLVGAIGADLPRPGQTGGAW